MQSQPTLCPALATGFGSINMLYQNAIKLISLVLVINSLELYYNSGIILFLNHIFFCFYEKVIFALGLVPENTIKGLLTYSLFVSLFNSMPQCEKAFIFKPFSSH